MLDSQMYYIQYIISDQPWNRRLEGFILLSILLVCWEKPRQNGGGVACIRFWGPCEWFGRGIRAVSWLVFITHIWSNIQISATNSWLGSKHLQDKEIIERKFVSKFVFIFHEMMFLICKHLMLCTLHNTCYWGIYMKNA